MLICLKQLVLDDPPAYWLNAPRPPLPNHAGNQQDVGASVCAPWPLNGRLFHALDDSVVIEPGFSDAKCKSCVCLTRSRGLIVNSWEAETQDRPREVSRGRKALS